MKTGSFADTAVQNLPENLVDPKSRQRFRKLADELDSIGRIEDSTGEVYIHKRRFNELLRECFSDEFAEHCLVSLAALPDNRFLPEPNRGPAAKHVRPIGWEELRRHAGRAVPEDARRDFHPGRELSVHDAVLKALQEYWPSLPNNVLDPINLREQLLLRFDVLEGAEVPLTPSGPVAVHAGGDFFNCLVSHLGFWGAVAAVVFIAVVSFAFDAAIIAVGWEALGSAAFWDAFWEAFALYGVAGAVFYVIVFLVVCLFGLQPPF